MRLGIVGASHAVAEGLLEHLPEALELSLSLFERDPEPGAGTRFRGRTHAIEATSTLDCFEFDILVVCDDLDSAEVIARDARHAGCHLIDASGKGLFADAEWAVPELLNAQAIPQTPVCWALPGSAVAAVAAVLSPISAHLQGLNVFVCNPASALGEQGAGRLASETAKLLNGQGVNGERLAFNLLPVFDDLAPFQQQCLSILLNSQEFGCHWQEVIAPLFYGQLIQLSVQLQPLPELSELRSAWRRMGIHLVDNKQKFSPVALAEDDRIHLFCQPENLHSDGVLDIWLVVDNIRKGAIVNTIQLIQILIKSSI